ncbi:MAG: bifunctional (p)ppGpp synthetase/guanosine-3',5'-bis(diphosphate) 3'-pyrophosphohydrolase [Clostridiaceae bacterium]|nr:bifunctional (p)ppGpp synthetase/guanosine-3',5'-bis(diphosphate) 3'-pyrophosphohydrolase [Clostridiaceae bacterium]MDD6274486.1 bifunctional (p)ppGpp synthetase/guanosine-3',5'-bis(diphosphate) 3'-pyrophosphohydrolase [Clostridiaceae bacterium]
MKERIEAIIKKINCSETDAARIRDAFDTADAAHEHQLRSSGEPYIIHPLAVAEILADLGLDPDTIIAALLHDAIEDTNTTYAQIKQKFGVSVADMVEGVTKLTRMTYETAEEVEIENLRKMFIAMARDIRVIIIKLVDRLHNMRTLMYRPPEKQRKKALETMQIYAPIAHRLGMNSIKVELEDLAIKYLDPVGYKEIVDYLEKNNKEGKSMLDTIMTRMKERLKEHGINAYVEGRIKHIYGIYRKVYMMNRDIAQVYDIYAMRVIVDTIPQCYNVLGIVHELYHPMPGRFKDYIYTPKPNMYQSLHTTVIGRGGQPFEVQIRTWDMHNTAEYGIAAHWKYKDNITKKGDEEIFAWVRRFIENQQDNDSEEFFTDLRVELFADEVFVFTPKGDVINLPADATPIDFAYAIHSAVGNRMVGAKVNGKIVPLDSKLSNGDIVEILTSNAARGPSRDWLSIVKTGEARNKIKQWFKKERREENIQLGRAEFEAELRRNLLVKVFEDEDFRAMILKKLDFQNMEDLYAAMGYGGITVRKVISRITDEHNRMEKQARGISRPLRETKPTSGVIVEGIDNCLVKFARCCTPIPGDDIIGFITKGYGVSIHRRDCPNIVGMLSDPSSQERMIRVTWASTPTELYQTALQVTGVNRIGLLADVATAISDMNIQMSSVSARAESGNNTIIDLVVNLRSAEQLGSVMLRLKRIQGVSDVTRVVR